jgi:hypothetical protein
MNMTSEMMDMLDGTMPGMDTQMMQECMESCMACEQACTMAAGMMPEDDMMMKHMMPMMSMHMNCADLCGAMGRMMMRPAGMERTSMTAMLEACMTMCRACADMCMRHADMMPSCKMTAEVCTNCADACQKMMDSMKSMMATD